MQIELHLDAETMGRLEEQSRLLQRTYKIEFDKDLVTHPPNPLTAIRLLWAIPLSRFMERSRRLRSLIN
jgi:hypothetical protein